MVIRPQNMPQSSNSLLSSTKSMVRNYSVLISLSNYEDNYYPLSRYEDNYYPLADFRFVGEVFPAGLGGFSVSSSIGLSFSSCSFCASSNLLTISLQGTAKSSEIKRKFRNYLQCPNKSNDKTRYDKSTYCS